MDDFSARHATAARVVSGSWTTTRTLRTDLSSCTWRRGSSAGCSRLAGLALLAIELFGDEEHGGFFLSPADGDPRVARTKDLQDTPIPSGNSMLAHVLLRLGRIWGDDELERRAVSAFRLVEPALQRAPGFFAWMLCGIDLWLSVPRELAIVGDVESPVARAALAPFQPRTVVAVGPSDDVPLLAGKELVDGKPAVYACERFVCRAPVTEPEEVAV